MPTGVPPVHGYVTLVLEEEPKITYQVEAGEDCASFIFWGTVEIALNMRRRTIELCRDRFDQALTEIARKAALTDDEKP